MTVINCKMLRFYNRFTVDFTVVGGQIGCPYFTFWVFFFFCFLFLFLFVCLFFFLNSVGALHDCIKLLIHEQSSILGHNMRL